MQPGMPADARHTYVECVLDAAQASRVAGRGLRGALGGDRLAALLGGQHLGHQLLQPPRGGLRVASWWVWVVCWWVACMHAIARKACMCRAVPRACKHTHTHSHSAHTHTGLLMQGGSPRLPALTLSTHTYTRPTRAHRGLCQRGVVAKERRQLPEVGASAVAAEGLQVADELLRLQAAHAHGLRSLCVCVFVCVCVTGAGASRCVCECVHVCACVCFCTYTYMEVLQTAHSAQHTQHAAHTAHTQHPPPTHTHARTHLQPVADARRGLADA
jgi:hypothetical protein